MRTTAHVQGLVQQELQSALTWRNVFGKNRIVSKLEIPESNSAELAALDKPQHS